MILLVSCLILTPVTELRYFDTITIRHKDTRVFLHSHPDRYPLKYDDGRISSQGMRYTHVPHARVLTPCLRSTGYWLWPRGLEQPLADHSY